MGTTVTLPEGKMLLPGVICHATNVVEHPELLAERLIRLARPVGPEYVAARTDCGFAQGPFGRRVHPSIMWTKLRVPQRRRRHREPYFAATVTV
jgi:5-methyltetrahydropteroyltriglutamate--homocysteine methyltransferase